MSTHVTCGAQRTALSCLCCVHFPDSPVTTQVLVWQTQATGPGFTRIETEHRLSGLCDMHFSYHRVTCLYHYLLFCFSSQKVFVLLDMYSAVCTWNILTYLFLHFKQFYILKNFMHDHSAPPSSPSSPSCVPSPLCSLVIIFHMYSGYKNCKAEQALTTENPCCCL